MTQAIKTLTKQAAALLLWALAAWCGWATAQADAPPPSAEERESGLRLLFNSPLQARPSRTCESPLCAGLLDLLSEAQESVEFAVYGYRRAPVLLAELRRAARRGAEVRGVVDQSDDGDYVYPETRKLRQAAELRGDAVAKRKRRRALMHNKFFVADGRRLWTGSANLTETGVGGFNANVAVLIESPQLAARYLDTFEQMFAGRPRRAKSAAAAAAATPPIAVRTGGGQANVSAWFSPQQRALSEGVVGLLDAARVSVDVGMFVFTHPAAAQALIRAHQRGARVRVILDATGARNRHSQHQLLRRAGVRVKVENWAAKMHMKAALADGRHLVIGSMNWTRAGERRNDENTLIVRDVPDEGARFARFFDAMWSSIPERWEHADPLPESPQSPGSCDDGVDNDFDRRRDAADPDCR